MSTRVQGRRTTSFLRLWYLVCVLRVSVGFVPPCPGRPVRSLGAATVDGAEDPEDSSSSSIPPVSSVPGGFVSIRTRALTVDDRFEAQDENPSVVATREKTPVREWWYPSSNEGTIVPVPVVAPAASEAVLPPPATIAPGNEGEESKVRDPDKEPIPAQFPIFGKDYMDTLKAAADNNKEGPGDISERYQRRKEARIAAKETSD